jgi:hypothetical protein
MIPYTLLIGVPTFLFVCALLKILAREPIRFDEDGGRRAGQREENWYGRTDSCRSESFHTETHT